MKVNQASFLPIAPNQIGEEPLDVEEYPEPNPKKAPVLKQNVEEQQLEKIEEAPGDE